MTTALDTSLIVRLLNNDDPKQAGRARVLLESGPVFVPKTVMLETEWVLRSAYGLERDVIDRSFRAFLGLPNVTIEDEEAILHALNAYAAGMDLADALHLSSSARQAARFATFDRALRRRSGRVHGLLPVFEP